MTSNDNEIQPTADSTSNTSDIGRQDQNCSLNDRVNDIFNTMPPPLTTECCIYRVPRKLRMLNEAAYTPHVISIGPFHRDKQELKFMEKHKVRYLHRYIHTYEVSLDHLLTTIKNSEDRLRGCYEESIELNSDDFVMMILLDSLFIIEYFTLVEVQDEDDRLLYRTKLGSNILDDLLLLENQLPFFILESLYNSFSFLHRADQASDQSTGPANDQTTESFTEISCQVFYRFSKRNITPVNVKHFTDLIRTLHIPSSSMVEEAIASRSDIITKKGGQISYYSAKELHEAGLHFEVSSSDCLFDIEFKINKGVMHIPRFEFEESTGSLYRNLMALEQFKYSNQAYMCDYISLMGTLIDTSKDVELLVKNRILEKWVDRDILATLFKTLGVEMRNDPEKSYFYRINQDLFKYYKRPTQKVRASLKRSSWKIASVTGNVIILPVLALLQTINSCKSP